MRKLEQVVGDAKLIHDLHHARMDRVAAKFAIEVVVCLKDRNADSQTSQQHTHDNASGSAAHDATIDRLHLSRLRLFVAIINVGRRFRHRTIVTIRPKIIPLRSGSSANGDTGKSVITMQLYWRCPLSKRHNLKSRSLFASNDVLCGIRENLLERILWQCCRAVLP